MDFNHMKLFTNHSLRQEMPTAKYYSTGRCTNDSNLYQSKLDGIPNHLITLSSQITSNKQFTNPNFNDTTKLNNKILVPTMLSSLKSIFFETFTGTKGPKMSAADTHVTRMHLISETRTIINNNYNNKNDIKLLDNQNTQKNYNQISKILKTNNINSNNYSNTQNTSNNSVPVSTGRYDNNLQLKAKQLKKSPNTMFYRNLIEEISAKRKIPSTKINSNQVDETVEEYALIQNPKNSLIKYEIRYSEAKREKPLLIESNKMHKSFEMNATTDDEQSTVQKLIKKMVLEPKIPKYFIDCNELNETTEQHTEECIPLDCDDSDDSFIIFNNSSRNNSSDSDDYLSSTPDDQQNHRQRRLSDCDSDDSFIIFDDNSALDEEQHQEMGKNSLSSSSSRLRHLSDCDSEDSFIMFTEEDDDDDDTETDTDTDDDNNSHDEEDYQEQIDYIWGKNVEDGEESDEENDTDILGIDEPDFCSGSGSFENKIWSNAKVNSIQKKVQFKPNAELAVVHPMIAWSYAYHNARKGHWEEAARDRSRFQLKIRRLHDIIKPVLMPEHRIRIYSERFQ